MTDEHLEDHAFGVELQLTELVEQLERARVQGLPERAAEIEREIEALQNDLVQTAETIADEHYEHAEIHEPEPST